MNVHFLKRKVQALKYALDPYTSKAKDIVNQNPGGYAWERSKKNPDLPGVKERVPIGANKNLAGPLHGTKLAVVLQEIRDRFGSVDPQLKALAEKALSGKGNLQHQVSQDNTYAKTKAMITKAKLGQQAPGEVAQTAAQPFTPEKHEDLFTAIRDRLAKHSQGGVGNSPGSSDLAARAGELARSYNWHRVGAGLQVDEAVRDYINKVTGDRLKHANEAHRTVHNLFGLGSEQRRQGKVSDTTHQAFWDGLRKHVNERAKGANSVYGLSARDLKDDMLHKSIRRLAEAEEHIYGTPGKAPTDPPHVGPSYANYKTAGLRQLGPNAKIAPPTFEKPAYSPTKTGVRVNPRARAAQFRRKVGSKKYSAESSNKPYIGDPYISADQLEGEEQDALRFWQHPNGTIYGFPHTHDRFFDFPPGNELEPDLHSENPNESHGGPYTGGYRRGWMRILANAKNPESIGITNRFQLPNEKQLNKLIELANHLGSKTIYHYNGTTNSPETLVWNRDKDNDMSHMDRVEQIVNEHSNPANEYKWSPIFKAKSPDQDTDYQNMKLKQKHEYSRARAAQFRRKFSEGIK